jgi:hypothetical protein
MMAASILQARFRNFTEVEGGFNAITKTIPKRTLYAKQSFSSI